MITTLENAMLTFMKKLSKEQIEKRRKIKQYLLRSLNIVCYILSALFIIVCIVVGVQSCGKKTTNQNNIVNKQNDTLMRLDGNAPSDYDYFYEFNYEGTNTTIPLNVQDVLVKMVNTSYSVYNNVSGPSGGFELTSLYFDDLYVFNYLDNSYDKVDHFNILISKYYPNSSSTNDVRYRLMGLHPYYYNSDGSYAGTYLAQRISAYYENDYYNITSTYNYHALRLYSSKSLLDNAFISLLFTENHPFDFTFNYSLNYYWWVSNPSQTSADNQLDIVNSSVFLNLTSYYDLYLNTGYFTSNERLYNRIVLRYAPLVSPYAPVNWMMPDGTLATLSASNGYGLFGYLAYENTDTNTLDIVYRRNSVVVQNNGAVEYYQTNNCSWVNESWRHIHFTNQFEETSEIYIQLISLNRYSSISSYSGNITDIFTLLKNTFSSIIPILNLAILPNFTIGMLLVIPLAVTSIIVIVRLVKK